MRDFASLLPVALHQDLLNAGWDGELKPYPGINHRQFAMGAIARSLLKKFEDNPSTGADERALSLFVKMNKHCETYQVPDLSSAATWEAIALGEAKTFLQDFFSPGFRDELTWQHDILNSVDIANHFALGNGSNIGSKGTDFLSKIGTSTLATTSFDLYRFFIQAVATHRVWSDVESIRSVNRGVQLVQGSRLSFVPKNTDISRTICTEPILNMLFQKGIGACIERRLRRVFNIDLATQPDYNRALCRLGAATGEFGTIDLSSASDSISRNLVEWLLPRSAVYWLNLCRSTHTELPNGEVVELHMISSMGNAYTFPLQTVIFASLVYGAYKTLDLPVQCPTGQSMGNFAVFGDDIIVQKKAYGLVCRLLSMCGFIVNVDKSFNEGLFRESCGVDCFGTTDVRGVYIKSLKTSSDRYSAINRLNVWSTKHAVPLPYTIAVLLKGLRFLPIPPYENEDGGIWVPLAMLKNPVVVDGLLKKSKLGSAYDQYMYGIKYKVLVPRIPSIDINNVEELPAEEQERNLLRGWFENPSAILLAAIAGTLRDGKVVPRSTSHPSVVKVKYSSGWDYIPPAPHVSAEFVGSWKAFCEANLKRG